MNEEGRIEIILSNIKKINNLKDVIERRQKDLPKINTNEYLSPEKKEVKKKHEERLIVEHIAEIKELREKNKDLSQNISDKLSNKQ